MEGPKSELKWCGACNLVHDPETHDLESKKGEVWIPLDQFPGSIGEGQRVFEDYPRYCPVHREMLKTN